MPRAYSTSNWEVNVGETLIIPLGVSVVAYEYCSSRGQCQKYPGILYVRTVSLLRGRGAGDASTDLLEVFI